MHHGVYIGDEAEKRTRRILILGESHHVSTDKKTIENKKLGEPAAYPTEAVVREYLRAPYGKSLRFFDKIAASFGYNPECSREDFWKSVYFGNYIDVLCGIQDGYAAQMVRCEKNRRSYNDQLFTFINDHGISALFCYGIATVYNKLPGLCADEIMDQSVIGRMGSKNVYLRSCRYRAGVEHSHTSVVLKNDLDVFGMGHPSAIGGFPAAIYAKVLADKK